MKLIEWSEKYSVGNGLMDAYHHIFFEMVKEFVQESNRGNFTRESVEDSLSFLVRYTLMHFQSEERLLEKHGYPDLESHREVHRKFAEDIQELERRFRQYPEALPAQEVFCKAMVWFAQHILGEDMKYRPHLEGVAG